MKEYLEQFYNEGLATTFYLRPIKYIDSKFKNKKISQLIKIIIKIIYTILAILFMIEVFYYKFPL